MRCNFAYLRVLARTFSSEVVPIKAGRFSLPMMLSRQEIFLRMTANTERVPAFQGNARMGGEVKMMTLQTGVHCNRSVYVAELIHHVVMTA